MASTSDLEGQSLTAIADYHNDVVDSLTFYLQQLRNQNNSRFIGYTLAEFNDLLLGRIEETDLRSSLAVLAAVEAALRIDYLLRATKPKRRKDPLSIAFRTIYRRKRKNARFEDLLDLWGKHYSELKRYLFSALWPGPIARVLALADGVVVAKYRLRVEVAGGKSARC
jgi:hypothetical protein